MTYWQEVLRRHSKEEDSGSGNTMRWQEVSIHGCKDIDRPVKGNQLKRCSEVDLNARRKKVVEGFREKMGMSEN